MLSIQVYDAGMDIGQVSVKEALQNTLFDSRKATVWILEGLVMYAPQLVHIMNDCQKRISEQASGVAICLSVLSVPDDDEM